MTPKQLRDLFSRRLVALRSKLGLTRAQVAVRARVSSSYLGMLERGERLPSLEQLLHFAEVLNVSPAFFFERPADADHAARTASILHLAGGLTLEDLRLAVRLVTNVKGGK